MDCDDAPHWQVEHATSGMATCNSAACKSKGTKIEKSELRVGTHTSEESREQLKLAMEQGKITDKTFKDIRLELVQPGKYMGELQDAVGYKVEVSPSARAGCRATACKEHGSKIAKGELRLGILRQFDGEHESFVYKHW